MKKLKQDNNSSAKILSSAENLQESQQQFPKNPKRVQIIPPHLTEIREEKEAKEEIADDFEQKRGKDEEMGETEELLEEDSLEQKSTEERNEALRRKCFQNLLNSQHLLINSPSFNVPFIPGLTLLDNLLVNEPSKPLHPAINSAEITSSQMPSSEKFLATRILELRDALFHSSSYYQKIRISSLISIKSMIQNRRMSIQAIKFRLEEIIILYRIQLTKRYQLYQIQEKRKQSNNLSLSAGRRGIGGDDLIFLHSLENLHPNPLQLIIQPEHFPRVVNQSGLISKRKDHFQSKNIPTINPNRSPFENIWEGSEYKIQLLSSLKIKLIMKYSFELWKYSLYLKKLLTYSNDQIRSLQKKTLLKIAFQALLFNYFSNQYIELMSMKKSVRYQILKSYQNSFAQWKDLSISSFARRLRSSLKLSIQTFNQKLFYKYAPTVFNRIRVLQKRNILKRFSEDYSKRTNLFKTWKKWQQIFIEKHFIRLEIIQQYYQKDLQKSEDRQMNLEQNLRKTFSPSNLQFLLARHQGLVRKQYLEMLEKRKMSFPKSDSSDSSKAFETYLVNHNHLDETRRIQQQMKELTENVLFSKKLLPNSRFDKKSFLNSLSTEGEERNSFSIKNAFYDENRPKPSLEIEPNQPNLPFSFQSSPFQSHQLHSSVTQSSPTFQQLSKNLFTQKGPFSSFSQFLTLLFFLDLNFSSRFTSSLIAHSGEITSGNDNMTELDQILFQELTPELKSKLWKYLQKKRVRKFLLTVFFHKCC